MIATQVKPINTTKTIHKTKVTWSAPTMVDQRSAFEVTAYQKVLKPTPVTFAWSAPTMVDQRSAFEVTAYQKVMTPKASIP